MTMLRFAFLTFVFVAGGPGCTPVNLECSSKLATDLIASESAVHCAFPPANDHGASLDWLNCVLGALRDQRPIDGGMFFVIETGMNAMPYATNQQGTSNIYGPCPRVVIWEQESHIRPLVVGCGTPEYNPGASPVAYPQHDEARLLTRDAINQQLAGGGRIVLDFPEAIAPPDGTCQRRALQFPDRTDPIACGSLGPPVSALDAHDITYPGYTCHAVSP